MPQDQTPREGRRRPLWERDENAREGGVLAALRSGLGREPGTAPGMWEHYTTLREDGHPSKELTAEHIALGFYGIHQQGKGTSVHRPGTGFGTLIRAVRDADKHSAAATDRRFSQAITATDVTEFATHARALIRLARELDSRGGLDYTQLYRDLVSYQFPESVGRVRRRWAGQYYHGPRADHESTEK